MNQLRLLLLLLFIITGHSLKAQTYGNEWINYSQSYYAFQIYQDGIYRLDYDSLLASGIPLGSFSADNIQIFGKEREIPIFVEDHGDGTLDPTDYIIFYAEANDTWLDSTMYEDPNTIGNPGYNNYNDTLLYFFTWNNSTNNLRFTVESDVNFANYSNIESYVWSLSSYNGNTYYYEGKSSNSDIASSFYKPGEGWALQHRNAIPNGYTFNQVVSTPQPYTGPGAPEASFIGRCVSTSNADVIGANPNHHSQWQIGSSNTILLDTTWKGLDQIRLNTQIPTSLLTNGNTPVKLVLINDLGVASDYQAFQYASIEYPRNTHMGNTNGIDFRVQNNPQGKIRIDWTGTTFNSGIAMVFGETPRMVPVVTNGTAKSMLIPNTLGGGDQNVILRDSTLIKTAPTLTPVNGTGTFTDYANEVPEEALLMIYHPKLATSSQNYAAYRSIDYNTYLANVEELYMQFGGGIRKHVYGIRRFVHFVYNNSTVKPVGLFLMGKGIREASIGGSIFDGSGTRKSTTHFGTSLIPSYGQPSSDVGITAGLEGTDKWTPLIPTGRISALNDQELQEYLDKVEVYEQNQNQNDVYDTPNKDWQKHVLHFAGGSNAGEQYIFQAHMDSLSYKIEDSLFGGYTHKIYKTSSNPLDPTILSEVVDRISEGVSIMSYFGHSSSTNSGFEINLDEPANWNNEGKYPLMLVNSCYNGNVFQATISRSEEFVQVQNYGAIGYIASVSVGISNYLNRYSQELYKNLAKKNYGKPLGELMQATIAQLEANAPNLEAQEVTCMQMVLNGDPMLKVNWHTRPEIELTPDDISFSPTFLDWSVDSIEMQIVLTNLGVSVTDTFQVEVTRHFPQGGIDSVYNFYIPKLNYSDTLRFKMPLQANIALGQNTFEVRVDIPSFIDEQYEEITNNQVVRTLNINLDGILPVIPYEFAVVPNSDVTVKASTVDPLAEYNTYRFEIDTVDFEGTVPQSGEYRYALVSGLGGVKEVNPSQWLSVATNDTTPLVCEDSVVYFWRVQVDGDSIWHESSFQYIEGKTGWGQDHFYQFKKNSFGNISYDRVPRERNFNPQFKEVVCHVNSTINPPTLYENGYFVDGSLAGQGIGVGATPKLAIGVIDPVTLEPWHSGYDLHGSYNPGPYTSGHWRVYYYRQDNPAELDSAQNLLLNVIPDGHYVLIYSPVTMRHDLFNAVDSADMYDAFTAIGCDSINPNRPNRPYIYFCKKGEYKMFEGYAPQGGELHMVETISGSATEGREESTIIGPASNWGNVYWKQDPMESPSDDTTNLYIIAYDINGIPQTSFSQVFTADDSLLNLNSILDAAQYPYISLRADYEDTLDFTPSQVDRWHVLFSPLPEAAIDGSSGYYWSAGTDPINEGEDIEFAVDVRNIFNIDMDSLLVNYWIIDENNIRTPLNYPRQDSLRVPDLLRDTISFSTTGFGGSNTLFMEINPYINGSFVVTDQPEQEHFNNLLQIPFFVERDDEHPILDVTFNGNHILNGDIVDPYSEILITLKDDNPFLVMDSDADTSLFGIYITDPSGNQQRVPFMSSTGETVMQWVPANASNMRFKIIWPAAFEQNGKYTLSVQGSDKSGNLSGDLDYNVDFEIIHESTITAMMNYPNPFSTSTRFVFTLTGSEVPDDILIQIMTVSGRVVREINEAELGPIQIGRNITEFAWDGTDQFGDPLANGVYLYRVITHIDGEEIEHRESGADQYFTKNFGKMYLLR